MTRRDLLDRLTALLGAPHWRRSRLVPDPFATATWAAPALTPELLAVLGGAFEPEVPLIQACRYGHGHWVVCVFCDVADAPAHAEGEVQMPARTLVLGQGYDAAEEG